MKQLIVMVATVMLGIAIGVMVMGFTTQAESMQQRVGTGISQILEVYDSSDTGE